MQHSNINANQVWDKENDIVIMQLKVYCVYGVPSTSLTVAEQ